MNETRWVFSAFAAIGLLMVLLPVGLVVSASSAPVPMEKSLDGEVSRFFLASESRAGLEAPLPGVMTVLPVGTAKAAAVKALVASAFHCDTASNRMICLRSHDGMSCRDDWSVELALDDHDAIRSASAQRRSTCL